MDLEIQEEFYRDLHHCISFASYHQGKGEHLKLRPPFHIKPHDSPKLYWQYAISAVLLIIRKQKLNKINISQSTQKYNPSEDRGENCRYKFNSKKESERITSGHPKRGFCRGRGRYKIIIIIGGGGRRRCVGEGGEERG